MLLQQADQHFAVCIQSGDCEDLELLKIYQVLTDEDALQDGYLRIIDASGEDYLYPEQYFLRLDLPQATEDVLAEAYQHALSGGVCP